MKRVHTITDRRRNRLTFSALSAVALSGLAVACSSPPSEEMEAARLSLETATAAGASEYTPEMMSLVSETQAALEAELAAQEGKVALFRRYDRARQLADSVRAVSTRASEQVAVSKEQVRQETEALLVEVRTALTEVVALWEKAPAGKGSAADLAALRGDLDGVSVALTEAETALTQGRFMEAKTKAVAARETTAGVRTALDRAVQMRGRAG